MTTSQRIHQTFTREANGWTVLTYANGLLRRQTWTAGGKREANKVAAEDRQQVTA